MIDALCSCVERRRLYARWIMLFLTFGALIGLTVARYVGSDDELRSVVTLIRDTEPLKMKEKDVANATCPCQVCSNSNLLHSSRCGKLQNSTAPRKHFLCGLACCNRSLNTKAAIDFEGYLEACSHECLISDHHHLAPPAVSARRSRITRIARLNSKIMASAERRWSLLVSFEHVIGWKHFSCNLSQVPSSQLACSAGYSHTLGELHDIGLRNS